MGLLQEVVRLLNLSRNEIENKNGAPDGLNRAKDHEVQSPLDDFGLDFDFGLGFDTPLNSQNTIWETLQAADAILTGLGDRRMYRGKDALLATQVGFDAIRELLLVGDGEGTAAASSTSTISPAITPETRTTILASLDSMADVMAKSMTSAASGAKAISANGDDNKCEEATQIDVLVLFASPTQNISTGLDYLKSGWWEAATLQIALRQEGKTCEIVVGDGTALADALDSFKPRHLVIICHGAGDVAMLVKAGEMSPTNFETLASVIAARSDRLESVVFNMCHSDKAADRLYSKVGPYFG